LNFIQKKNFLRRFLDWMGGVVNPLILLGYGFITVLTPRLNAIDSAGTKFLALAILNLVVYIYFLLRKEEQPPHKFISVFFSNKIGFLYILFLAVSLLSFFKAVNMAESLLAFSKLFTVFTAVMIIAAILRVSAKYLFPLAIGMSLLLLADAAFVFYQIYILAEKYPNFAEFFLAISNEVKSGYSNKNILASAMFVKLPFALWLWTFKKNLAKTIGIVAIFAGFLAILLMSARAFIVGLALLTSAYLVFLILRLFLDRKKIRSALYSLVIVALFPLFIYLGWLLLSHYSPTVRDFNLKDRITARLGTIKTDASSGMRIQSWIRSAKLIKDEPLLGVGIGNWKIAVLKYENQTTPDYQYYYYNHNDFIQTTSETGILGGMLFLSVFIGIGWFFLYALFKGPASGISYEYLFLPAFGLLCYSVDAFFNFPYDRPEIQSLWAIFLGAAVAYTPEWKVRRGNFVPRPASRVPFFTSRVPLLPILLILVLLSSIYLLYLNYRSLRLQSLFKYELWQGELRAPSALFMTGFSAIPAVSVDGEPIAVIKARYLISESKLTAAIALLKSDQASPWESRREYFISLSYEKLSNTDSAIVYALQVFRLKPLYQPNLDKLIGMLENREDYEAAAGIIGDYLACYEAMGPALDSYLVRWGDPRPTYVSRQADLKRKAAIRRMESFYIPAQYEFNQKNYQAAVVNYTKIIEREPGITEAWEKRAWCYYYLNEPGKCLADIDTLAARGGVSKGLEEVKNKVKR